jgi:glycosyltransferase involved in cell wall biosynthesis
MRIYAVVPTKNEAGRYLQACLRHLMQYVEGLLVCDDQSTDNTVELATKTFDLIHDVAHVVRRPDDVPSFLSNEAAFRSWVIAEAISTFKPTDAEDWILVIDADEFLVAPSRLPTGVVLEGTLSGLQRAQIDTVRWGRDEIWRLSRYGHAQRRIDKLWHPQTQERIFRYRAGEPAGIGGQTHACGSVPTYAMRYAPDVFSLRIVHVGYADPIDRLDKYERYRTFPGHNPDHIESIMDPDPVLEPIDYVPSIWRGTR